MKQVTLDQAKALGVCRRSFKAESAVFVIKIVSLIMSSPL